MRLDEEAALKFTSLPTFEEMHVGTEVIYQDGEIPEIVSRRSENYRVERASSTGLCSLNGDTVVAQIDKDVSNLTRLIKRKVVTYQKNQLKLALDTV